MVQECLNFLNKEWCDFLIDVSKEKYQKMTVVGGEERNNGARIADGVWLNNDSEASKVVRERISKVTNLPTENMENVHIVKYEVGGEYKPHFDYFNVKVNAKELERGGQRIKSVLVYLNDDFEGGETQFPKLKLTVKPQIGKLIVWDNVSEGKENPNSVHAGLPVTKGTKYIMIVWIRENKFK
jgi:prolyl 4-hydroxylase